MRLVADDLAVAEGPDLTHVHVEHEPAAPTAPGDPRAADDDVASFTRLLDLPAPLGPGGCPALVVLLRLLDPVELPLGAGSADPGDPFDLGIEDLQELLALLGRRGGAGRSGGAEEDVDVPGGDDSPC
jgi:hypothetical protein